MCMKRIDFLTTGLMALALTLLALPAKAQNSDDEYGIFDHLGAGISLGTDGIGIDVAAPITDMFAVRAGVSFLPKIKIKKNIKIDDNNPTVADNVDLQGKLNVFNGKLLADFYPFKSSSFHLTAGAFIGSDKLATITNTSMFIKDPSKYGKLGLKMGDYRITTDKQGKIDADVKVNSFKPYLGFGFGRAVPKNRISVSCDFGVQFWGKPALGAITTDDWGDQHYHKFKSSDLDDRDDDDLRDAVDILEKIVVYPVLNIRLSGRIF